MLVGGDIADQHWFRDGWMERAGYDPRGIGYGGFGLITGYTVAEMQAVPHLSAAHSRMSCFCASSTACVAAR